MKFTNPSGTPARVTDEPLSTENPQTPSTEAPSKGEDHREVMSFQGDTTHVDTRKGTPEVFEPIQSGHKKHGCLFRGCMTVLGVLAIIITVIILGARLLKNKISSYLGEQALPIPAVTLDEQVLTKARDTFAQLQGKQAIPAETEALTLNANEINQLLAHYQTTQQIEGQLYTVFTGGTIVIYGTVPVARYSLGLLGDKRFNIGIQLTGSYENNQLDARILKILLDKHDVTTTYEHAVGTLRITPDADMQHQLERFETIIITGEQLMFVPK